MIGIKICKYPNIEIDLVHWIALCESRGGCNDELGKCADDVEFLQGEYTGVLVLADELSEDLSLCLDDCAGHLKTVLNECRDSQHKVNAALGILDGLVEEPKP